MGLSVGVGGLIGEDEEGDEYHLRAFSRVNAKLKAMGLPEHHEPEVPEDRRDGFDMYGYVGLHYLRRVAAHLWFSNRLPPPGNEQAVHEDPVVEAYYVRRGYYSRLGLEPPKPAPPEPPKRSLFHRRTEVPAPPPMPPGEPVGRATFDHLMFHSDCEGYYFPADFPEVIFETRDVPGGTVGSSQRLLHECEVLAGTLRLPLTIDPEAEELWQAAERQGTGPGDWQRYGVESFTCARLYHAAKLSVELGAVIYFM